MNRINTLTLSTALAVGTIMSSAVPIQAVADTGQSTSVISSVAQNPAFEYSARKILGYVSEARAALDNEDKDDAAAEITMAMRELESIHDTKNYLEMMGVSFGRVFYGNGNSYYIPVADDTYAVRSYKSGPFWSPSKATAVSDVKIVTASIAIDPTKAAVRLQKAQQELAKNDYSKANDELGELLRESIQETASSEDPFAKLQDNIYLTRVLLRQHNYDGARYALRNAKSALGDYQKVVSVPERDTDVKTLHQEIDVLDKAIQKRDPTLLDKATAKVEKWWEDLKSWAKK